MQMRVTCLELMATIRLQITSYYVTFQVESGDRMELSVSGREYGMLAEGDIRETYVSGNEISVI